MTARILLTLKDGDDLSAVRKWVHLADGLDMPLDSLIETSMVGGITVSADLEILRDFEGEAIDDES
jgi:hypothetical protein